MGKSNWLNYPPAIAEETPVIVTFLTPGYVDLRERGIDERQAAELRTRYAAFAEDWDAPEMDVYDSYESNNGI